MSILRTAGDDEVTGLAAEQYAADRKAIGYVPSHTRVMSLNPEAVAAFENLIRAIVPSLGLRRYELVTLAAAGALRSKACRLAHGRKSLKAIDEEELIAIAADFRTAGLTEAEVAMMEFAERMCGDSSSMTDADSARLRELGFSDREILDITLAASARNYYSRALHALAVEVDEPPGLSAQLREALLAHL